MDKEFASRLFSFLKTVLGLSGFSATITIGVQLSNCSHLQFGTTIITIHQNPFPHLYSK